jgi:hypothetical protein
MLGSKDDEAIAFNVYKWLQQSMSGSISDYKLFVSSVQNTQSTKINHLKTHL